MEKLKMHTPNITDANIKKLAELFPNCTTEIKDETGNPKKVVDFDLLKQELSDNIVEGPQERYQLNWVGKKEALHISNAPIAKTLRPYKDESVNFETTQNLFIEGDNLDALKLLQETYLGKVKMIYIDPPYNTGNDFIYEDDFSENIDGFLVRSNQKDASGNRLIANTESNGRFHSDWLSMIYSRLKLARNLLRDDGVIFISIDDNEQANLKRLCDEIFGEDNYISTVTVVRSKNGLGSKEGFATNGDYLIVYKKSSSAMDSFLYLMQDEEYIKKFDKEDEFGKFKMDGIFRKKGAGQKRSDSPGCFYPIYYDNKGRIYLESGAERIEVYPKLPDGGDSRWIWSPSFAKDKLHRLYASKGGTIYVKDYLADSGRMKPKSVLDKTDYTTEVGTEQIKEIFNHKVFDTPKPLKLLVDLVDHGLSKEDIVIDFFSGSATTAHAVIQLNAIDGGNRKFIMVQIPEDCDKDSEAFKAGFKTIAEIGKERIRRSGNKVLQGDCHKDWNKDIGFRVLKIDTSNMADVFYNPDAISQDLLTDQVENIKPDRTSEDLLFQVLLDWGVDLTLPISREKIADKEVFFVAEDALAACFDNDITEDCLKAIAHKKPLRVVFRDSGFSSDSVKINVEQIFKLISPSTDIKTI